MLRFPSTPQDAPDAASHATAPVDPAEAKGGPNARGKRGAAAKPAVSTEALDVLWSALVAFAPRPDAWKLTPPRRKSLTSRLAEHDEATVRRVAEWVRTSTDDRATFLRERGDVDTLLRASKFATYAAMSAAKPPGASSAPRRNADAPLKRGELFWTPPNDPHDGALDATFEAL